jgi:hypothetical protein
MADNLRAKIVKYSPKTFPNVNTWIKLFETTFGNLDDAEQAVEFARHLEIDVLTEYYNRHEDGLQSGDECTNWLKEFVWESASPEEMKTTFDSLRQGTTDIKDYLSRKLNSMEYGIVSERELCEKVRNTISLDYMRAAKAIPENMATTTSSSSGRNS